MSLYTPVFPSLHEFNNSRRGLPENSSTGALGKQQNYVELLRDVHLFLSTQSDVLSPPSRPNSPSSDRRVQKVKEEVKDVLNSTGGETSSGKWTLISQTLKLGCVRGRYWSAPQSDPYIPKENTDWILPDEESEWIEWEKKREASRQFRGKANAPQKIGGAIPATPDSQKPGHASFAEQSRSYKTRERCPPGVSLTALRAAKEKVTKWQASMPSDGWEGTTGGSSPASARAVVAATMAKDKIEKPQRGRTIDFAVVKPVAKSIIERKGKGSLTRPVVRRGSVPTTSRKAKSPKPSSLSQDAAPVDVDNNPYARLAKTPFKKDHPPKISDISETPYLPPSFPTHLKTSTPLPDSVMVVRAKPSPILPLVGLSTPPSTPAGPHDDRPFVLAESGVADVSSSQPPQISTVDPGKRCRTPSTSLEEEDAPNDSPAIPPAKRLRTLSQGYSIPVSKHSKLVSPNGGSSPAPGTRDDAQGYNPATALTRRSSTDAVGKAIAVSLIPGKNDLPARDADVQELPEKLPSPTKSVKSFFSAPDSDPADSPLKANLLLESPVSPMLSYAQNASGFLPQITSTQARKGSPSPGATNVGVFGMGYSSQFDVERHVDRVSELLEKDVDFDGWLRDVRTMED
ncbi:hypothetical protein JVU11DRAFT_71 [Chiua virens]|nr:hypothetical protein JVU11DRAFT_71 [Chiua virens]